jgi:hypothetical protein
MSFRRFSWKQNKAALSYVSMMKSFPKSPKMVTSHTRMFLARGTYPKTWIKNMSTNLADPKIPLKFKLYRVRRWPGRLINA